MQVFIDTLAPSRFQKSWIYQVAAVTIALLLMATTTEVRFYLPFSPIPLSLHPLIVFLISYTLGSRRALMAIVPYVLWQTSLFGPSIGYFLGMIPAAYLLGRAAELGNSRSFARVFASLVVADLIILTIGSLGLAFFVGMDKALITGFVPFLAGDLFKVVVATSMICGTSHYLKKG